MDRSGAILRRQIRPYSRCLRLATGWIILVDDSLRQNQTHNPQSTSTRTQARYESRSDQQPNSLAMSNTTLSCS